MRYPTVGIIYHPRVPEARTLAHDLEKMLAKRVERVWTASAWDDTVAREASSTSLLVAVGGDGTVLRAARASVPHPVHVIGVNMGRLGFLSDLPPADAPRRLLDILDGAGRMERRTMVRGEVTLPNGETDRELGLQHALNDIAVGRSGGRPVDIHVLIDGALVEVLRADGIVVSTATGSTGYNLSAGGPVLGPDTEDLVLTPIAAHLSRVRPLVLPGTSTIQLRVESEVRAIVSFDGQFDRALDNGASVHVRRSEYHAHFLRLGPPSDFFRNLTQLLDSDRGRGRRG